MSPRLRAALVLLSLAALHARAEERRITDDPTDLSRGRAAQATADQSRSAAGAARAEGSTKSSGKPFDATGRRGVLNKVKRGTNFFQAEKPPAKSEIAGGRYEPLSDRAVATSGRPLRPTGVPSDKDVTPYKDDIDPVLRELRAVIIKLRIAAAYAMTKIGFFGVVLVSAGFYGAARAVARKLMFAARELRDYKQKRESQILARTALEVQKSAEKIRRRQGITPADVQRLTEAAGEPQRKKIEEKFKEKDFSPDERREGA